MSDFSASILVVDDDRSIRRTLCDRLEAHGHRVDAASSGEGALAYTRKEDPDLLLLDVHLPGIDGLQVLEALRSDNNEVAVIILTAYGDVDLAVRAMKLGAADFITKPFEPPHLDLTIEKTLEQIGLRRQNRLLQAELAKHEVPVIAESKAMQAVMRVVDKVANGRSTVLLLGESGTGKEVVARAIHAVSDGGRRSFVAANCAALPAELIESELFGHEQGAFTGATRTRKGLFEVADGGTLFLDEVGELPLGLQPKLLRVLQEQTFNRVGGTRQIKVNVRVIAATNKELEKAVENGEFRKDLFYRLDVVALKIPPLRSRPEDVEALARLFLERYRREMHSKVRDISAEAMGLLRNHSWPGNVRELENAIERALVLADGDILGPEDLPAAIGGTEQRRSTTSLDSMVELGFHTAVKTFKRQLLQAALARHDGVQVSAAKALDLHPTYLSRLLKNLSAP